MLWNWYTVNSCFIAKTWHVHSKGGFAGSCIGVFLLVVAAQWLNRFSKEYDNGIRAAQNRSKAAALVADNDKTSSSSTQSQVYAAAALTPEFFALSHNWLFAPRDNTYPTITQHLIRTGIFTVQWGTSYIIMLLFMYYNGYIIISCILGAFFGRLFFGYETLSGALAEEADQDDRKCCRG